MTHRYSISDNLIVEFRADDQSDTDAPWLRQPHYPNGQPFLSLENAEAWCERYSMYLNNEIADLPTSKEDVEAEPVLIQPETPVEE